GLGTRDSGEADGPRAITHDDGIPVVEGTDWNTGSCESRVPGPGSRSDDDHAATAFDITVPSRSSSTRKRLFTIAYSNSCQKWRRKPCTGQAAASPKAQMVWPSICPAAVRSMCRSSSVASRLAMRVSMRYIQPVPSRHGVHWPQLSL